MLGCELYIPIRLYRRRLLSASSVWHLPEGVGGHKGHDMDLNSRLFDRIRVKPAEREPEKGAGHAMLFSWLHGRGGVSRAERP